jgi:hypothetical protein
MYALISHYLLLTVSTKAVGTAEPSFTASNLESKSLSADEEDTLKWAAASLYAGGADTVCFSCLLVLVHDVNSPVLINRLYPQFIRFI